nr:hypothetical protein [Tanacetum cinerariifolium]
MLHVLRVEMVINSPWMLSKKWLVQKQTAFGKDISNPFMADNLLKIVWFSTHHVTFMKSWLVQKQTALGKTATGKESSNPFMAEIFDGLARMGYEKPSTKLTFYKAFFSTQWKFFIHTILHSLSGKRTSWNEFSSATTSAVICLSSEEVVTDIVPPTPTPPSPPSPVILSLPPHQPPCPPQPQDAEAAQQLEIVKLKARSEEAQEADDLRKRLEIIQDEDDDVFVEATPLAQKKAAKRRKQSEEAQEADDLRKRLEIVQDEDDDVFVEATPLAQKVPVVDYQIVVIDNKPKYKIIRADDTHQFYISFTTLLKNFDREDLETLWRIVRNIFSTSKPTNFSDEYLLLTLKTMFEELDGQDAIWIN